MSQGDGPTPPPFRHGPGGRSDRPRCGARRHRDRDRDHDRYRSQDDFAEAYLGKPRDMSWSDYLGLGGLGGATRRNSRPGWDGYGGRGRGGPGMGGDADVEDAAFDPAGAARPAPPGSGPRPPHGGPGREDSAMGRMDPLYSSPNPNRLFRNPREGKIAGVCAGLADYFNMDAALLRVGLALGLVFFPPVFFIGYIVLWWALKPRPQQLFESPEDERFWRSVSSRPDQTLAGLRTRFRALDRQISAIEGYVASNEFTLNRQFKDLEKG